jgi:hypothetical protein
MKVVATRVANVAVEIAFVACLREVRHHYEFLTDGDSPLEPWHLHVDPVAAAKFLLAKVLAALV